MIYHQHYIIDETLPDDEAQKVHVYPLGDLRLHIISKDCWCRPTWCDEGEVYLHNAMDRREDYETGKLKPH